MNKELWVTVDYPDDVLRSKRLLSKSDLDAMMRYAASLGATCVQWIYEPLWMFYGDEAAGGFDPLEVACEAAHRHGMRFRAVFKPFEGASAGRWTLLPHGLPVSEDAPLLHEPGGTIHAARDFVMQHPEMSIARTETGARDPGGRIAAVRLIKDDDAPSPFAAGDLSLWTSTRNGGYTKYDGPMSVTDTAEWRMIFPYPDRPFRIVTLGDLDLPADTRFVLIRRENGGDAFNNAIEQIAELVNERGDVIPSTPAPRLVDPQTLYKSLKWHVDLGLSRFARTTEARQILEDRDGFLELCQGMRRVDDAGWENLNLGEGGELALMRGKAKRRTGAMHPIYPEVRNDWLNHLRHCIRCGVDGINIRAANHNKVYEPRYYGFNPPVVEQMQHPDHFGEVRRINGDAYTLFLREAAELAHAEGCDMGVHVHGLMLRHDDRAANNSMVPSNFEWQWQTWLKEIADFAEYRGAFFFRPENQRYVADRIGFVARQAGVPLVYQSLRGHMMHFDPPHHAVAWEMDWVRRHPDVAAYNLYEMANIFRVDPDRGPEGSPTIRQLVRDHWSPPPDGSMPH